MEEKNWVQGALVLEGGGMRGMYTAGVLDFLLEKQLFFSDCYGVSAGACHCASYLSNQKGRAFRITIDYLDDPRYASMKSLVKTGDFFGVDMAYRKIPEELDLYDYEAFERYPGRFTVVVTNCRTGEAAYLPIRDMKREIMRLRASSSLPFFARVVNLNGTPYLDGGISDSIPLAKALQDGAKKALVVLTRDETYRKKPLKGAKALSFFYGRYPALCKAMEERWKMYNRELEEVDRAEKAGRAFVIRPQKPVQLRRLEKDKEKLTQLYWEGYHDAKAQEEALLSFFATERKSF